MPGFETRREKRQAYVETGSAKNTKKDVVFVHESIKKLEVSMKKIFIAAIVFSFFALVPAGAVRAEISMGISLSESGMGSFYLSLGNYSRVPEKEVMAVKWKGIPDEELPVVFFFASKAGVRYEEIVRLRLKRTGWMKIARMYNINPAVFYVPVNSSAYGRVYGRQYRYYTGQKQDKWKRIKLTDREIINFVNLRFVSEYYGYAPEYVMKMREEGKSFTAIDRDMRHMKMKKKEMKKESREKGRNRR